MSQDCNQCIGEICLAVCSAIFFPDERKDIKSKIVIVVCVALFVTSAILVFMTKLNNFNYDRLLLV